MYYRKIQNPSNNPQHQENCNETQPDSKYAVLVVGSPCPALPPSLR